MTWFATRMARQVEKSMYLLFLSSRLFIPRPTVSGIRGLRTGLHFSSPPVVGHLIRRRQEYATAEKAID